MDSDAYIRLILALIFVLSLIGLLTWLARRFRLGGGALAGRGARRVKIVETATLDARRRLVLVRRDGTEHLLLVGPAGDLVVERGIAAPGSFASHMDDAEAGSAQESGLA